MKIIITEEQYRILESYSEEKERVKKVFFQIWQNELDSNGEIDFNPKIVDYVNYTPYSRSEIYEMYVEFLGGWRKMIKKTYQLLNRTFNTMDYGFTGGYDFRFRIKKHSEYEEDNTTYVNCPIESDGKVTLMTNGETLLLNDVEEDENLWEDTEGEIRSVIEDILYEEVTKKTGIFVDAFIIFVEE